MQKQRMFALMSLVLVAAMLVGFGSAATTSRTLASTAEAMGPIPGAGLVTAGVDTEAKALTGSGATFPKPLYDQWVKEYKELTGVEINYKGGGSGQGRKDIDAEAVDFAGSDAPMKDEEMAAATGGTIIHIPTTLGAIVLIYNIPELADKGPLKFTGDVLAKIYLGQILKWNDPALVADNPDLADIDQDIITFSRSDGSGTTQNFTKFLSDSNKEWADTVKSGSTVEWPTQLMNPPYGRGAAQNAGVHDEVLATEYAIGYVELSYANDVKFGAVQNKASKFVLANAETVSAAGEGIEFPEDLRKMTVNETTAEDGYPITAMTWIVVYENQKDAKIGTAIVRFLWWALHDGQAANASLGYAPLPASVIAKAEGRLTLVKADGKQILPEDFVKAGVSSNMPAMEATAEATK
jgi:phosphate transport system substrate-binding protein